MMLTPEGKMARYLYGIRFRSRDLRFALTEASEGRSTLTIDKILLFCYHYDPQASSYVLFAQNLMTRRRSADGADHWVFLVALCFGEKRLRAVHHARKDGIAPKEWLKWSGFAESMLPPQGSAFAGEVDTVYMALVLAERGAVSGHRDSGRLLRVALPL